MQEAGAQFWRSRLLARVAGLTQGLSLRTGGVSPAPFDSLNVGLHVGDERVRVLENRQRVAEAAGVSLERWVCAQQVHGACVHRVTPADVGRGALSHEEAIPETDALIADLPGAVLTVFVADCAPVFLYDAGRPALGLAHAGWRSLAAGILRRTVEEMRARFGTDPERLFAAVGPSLGSCCFEVGPEVAERFDQAHVKRHPAAPGSHLDPWSVIRAQLHEAGVPLNQIDADPECTKCSPTRYFSYRGSGGETGRMVAVLGLGRR